jgi:hypothetical protein
MQASVVVQNPIDRQPILVDLYPIGVQYCLWVSCRMISRGEFALAGQQVWTEIKTQVRLTKSGNFRTFRQHWLGTYAEPRDWPFWLKSVGRGWTKKRAIRDLKKRLVRDYK